MIMLNVYLEYYVQFLDTESRLERYLIDKPSNDKTPPDLSSEELRKMQQDFIGLLSVDTKDTKVICIHVLNH